MLLPLLLACSIAVEASPWSDAIKTALEKPQLAENAVQEQVGAFVRDHVPALSLPADSSAWDVEQERLRQEFLEKIVYRGVPGEWRKGDVRVEWGGVLHPAPEYEIRKLRYEALPGFWIPAIVYVPASLSGKTVGILNVNGHVGPPGKSFEEEQLRCINLAKRGIVAFHPEWLSFGELQGEGYEHGRLAYLDLVGTSGLSVFYLALKRAVDVMETMPEVDPARIGMTGLSGGGWQTILFSALDTRIATAAPNAGYIGIGDRARLQADIGDLEQVPEDFLLVGDYTHLTAMLAPRPALIILNAKDNCCFEAAHTVPVVYDPHLPWYELYGVRDRFQLHVNEDPGTHNYGKDNRQAYYQFVKDYLMPEASWNADDLSVESELQTLEQLAMGLPPHNENFITLATAQYAKLPKTTIPGRDSAEYAAWSEAQRAELRKVLSLDMLGATAVESALEASTTGTDLQLSTGTLRLGSWTIPAALATAPQATPDGLVIALWDAGFAADPAQFDALVQAHGRVLALDLTFMGKAKPSGNAYQYPMLFNATGACALGLQVQELLDVAQWARQELGSEKVALHATGWNSSTAALMAAALAPDPITIIAQDAPASLFQLVQDKVSYNEMTPLFVFGLLPRFDVPVLQALGK